MRKNKISEMGRWWWITHLIATLAVLSSAETSVGIFNARLQQVTTSSTLKWKMVTVDPVIAAETENGKFSFSVL